MSRYDRYHPNALIVLAAARRHAQGAGREDCGPGDLIAALLGHVAAMPTKADGANVKLRLSTELREILNLAETRCQGEIRELDLLRATVDRCRHELTGYLGDSRPDATPASQPSTPPIGLEEDLTRSVIGQDHAVAAVAEALRLRSIGLSLRQRPLAFLFSGPTGVGKTKLAVRLAAHLTGRPDRLLRLDCSEFSEEHQVARLLGAPPSYVGYGTPSPLEEFLTGGPTGVILLDEFEKAHGAFHRLFLQVFDAGRLTNSAGKTLDVSKSLIIATANILMPSERPSIGFVQSTRHAQGESVTMEPFRRVFSLELLNRFDEIVMFKPLDRHSARRILREHLVTAANAQLGERHGVRLELSAHAETLVLERGYSEEHGARHLQRAFTRLVLNEVAGVLAQPNPSRGTWYVDVLDGEVQIRTCMQRVA